MIYEMEMPVLLSPIHVHDGGDTIWCATMLGCHSPLGLRNRPFKFEAFTWGEKANTLVRQLIFRVHDGATAGHKSDALLVLLLVGVKRVQIRACY